MGMILILLAVQSAFAGGNAVFNASHVRSRVDCSSSNGKISFAITGRATLPDEEESLYGASEFWILSPKPSNIEIESSGLLFVRGQGGICGKWAGFNLPGNQIVVPIVKNNRPFGSKIGFIHYDMKKKALKEILEPLDEFDNESSKSLGAPLELVNNRIKIRFWKSRTDILATTMKIEGEQAAISERDFYYWKSVGLEKGNLRISTDNDLTWRKSEWKKFFKNQNEFEKAFGFNSLKEFENFASVGYATLAKKVCIQPTRDRKPKESNAWYCIAKKMGAT